jgi:hypothetical protein
MCIAGAEVAKQACGRPIRASLRVSSVSAMRVSGQQIRRTEKTPDEKTLAARMQTGGDGLR